MKECKYRLPCNWCDVTNNYCDMAEPSTTKCEHDEHEWVFYKSTENTSGSQIYYRCRKCGAIRMIDESCNIYESGEWQP